MSNTKQMYKYFLLKLVIIGHIGWPIAFAKDLSNAESPPIVSSSTLILSPKKVMQQVVQNSSPYQQIKAKQNASQLVLANAKAFLDWQVFFQTHFSKSTKTPLSFFENPLEKKAEFLSSLEKPFVTGSRIKLQYALFRWDKDFQPEFKKVSSAPPKTFRQQVSLEVQQDLWRNIFGYEDRVNLRIAETQSQVQQDRLSEEVEELILKALRQFWEVVISHTSLKLKQAKKNDYKNLFQITKSKQQYNYTKPGELAQIQAEWEKAKQDLILQKTNYTNKLSYLLELLNYDLNSKVRFVVPKATLPAPPVFKKDISQTPRTVALVKKQVFIQEQILKQQRSRAWPTLQLFGTYAIGGYDSGLSSSFEGLSEGKNQDHLIGIRLRYPLGSSSLRRKRLDLQNQELTASKWELKSTQKEFKQLRLSAYKNAQSLYKALNSAKKIHNLRAKSYKEIRKAFSQGRLSVFDLIRAREQTLLSHLEITRFKAEYHQALAYIKALQDEPL